MAESFREVTLDSVGWGSYGPLTRLLTGGRTDRLVLGLQPDGRFGSWVYRSVDTMLHVMAKLPSTINKLAMLVAGSMHRIFRDHGSLWVAAHLVSFCGQMNGAELPEQGMVKGDQGFPTSRFAGSRVEVLEWLRVVAEALTTPRVFRRIDTAGACQATVC
jgi:hypothetical protein